MSSVEKKGEKVRSKARKIFVLLLFLTLSLSLSFSTPRLKPCSPRARSRERAGVPDGEAERREQQGAAAAASRFRFLPPLPPQQQQGRRLLLRRHPSPRVLATLPSRASPPSLAACDLSPALSPSLRPRQQRRAEEGTERLPLRRHRHPLQRRQRATPKLNLNLLRRRRSSRRASSPSTSPRSSPCSGRDWLS